MTLNDAIVAFEQVASGDLDSLELDVRDYERLVKWLIALKLARESVFSDIGLAARAASENHQLKAENAELVKVLHEVEEEAVYAYRCLQQDCVTTADSVTHFFEKWWHAESEIDRLKAENAKLRELVREAYAFSETLCGIVENSPGCYMCPANQDDLNPCGSAVLYGRMLDLGIEVDG